MTTSLNLNLYWIPEEHRWFYKWMRPVTYKTGARQFTMGIGVLHFCLGCSIGHTSAETDKLVELQT